MTNREVAIIFITGLCGLVIGYCFSQVISKYEVRVYDEPMKAGEVSVDVTYEYKCKSAEESEANRSIIKSVTGIVITDYGVYENGRLIARNDDPRIVAGYRCCHCEHIKEESK